MNTKFDCPDCGRTFFNEGLVRRGNVQKCEDCLAKDTTTTPTMNWIDDVMKEADDTQFPNLFCAKVWFRDKLQEAHSKGTQEALAKVEDYAKDRYAKMKNNGDITEYATVLLDLLHHLQQLKDNKQA